MISKKAITIISIAVAVFAVGSVLVWKIPSQPDISPTFTATPTPTPLVTPLEKDAIWLAAPQKIANLNLISYRDSGEMLQVDYYKLGEDQGSNIIFGIHDTQSLEGTYKFFFFQDDNQYRSLERHWDGMAGDARFNFSQQVVRDDYTYYTALDAPDQFIFRGEIFYGGGINLPISQQMQFIDTVDAGNLYTLITPHEVGLSLQEYVLRLPSGLISGYSAVSWPFLTDDRIPQITWTDGTVNSHYYDHSGSAGGCGTRKVVILSNPDLSQFYVGGTTSTGEPVYEYKNPDNPVARKFYDATGGQYYDGTTTRPLTFEEYVASHPVFIYHDALDRWVVFNNLRFDGGAECSKPVIYLYPEKPTQVSVKVDARITKSEPEYGDGWNVLAEPAGKQTLFWEGLGNGPYPEITGGFVVKRENLEATLRDHLAKLGLNARESQDFLDFWLEKMPTTPYMRLTWFGTRQMNALAPLTITPKPDTMIRIFLDFEGLEKPVILPEQKLSAIPRKGFTVIEWGGLLKR